ncbi:MAG: PD-(D/E)XK nuclease family protein [Verrucomicrobiota bacterium]|nr:PD-(D/E)XK nuclease family protein [Verrucomicrobiota bacterium]
MNKTPEKSTIQFLIGPAGSGKTFQCLEAIRKELKLTQEGPPLLLLTPKQATFQMEHALLSDPELHGYTRLQILSFDRLSELILAEFGFNQGGLLSEEGRVMLLRALLSQIKERMRIFRATSGLPGLAHEMSHILREFQQHRISPAQLLKASESTRLPNTIRYKLHDIGILYQAYQDWLEARDLHDPDRLLDLAARTLRHWRSQEKLHNSFPLGGVWLDGFVSLSPQERLLLSLMAPMSPQTTLAFCSDSFPVGQKETFSIWLPTHQTLRQSMHDFEGMDNVVIKRTILKRTSGHGRFRPHGTLAWLEEKWTHPEPYLENRMASAFSSESGEQLEWEFKPVSQKTPDDTIQLVECPSPEAACIEAARSILERVQDHQFRFRECAVMVRSLPLYQETVRHVFKRYGIPCFIDQRESVSHHPLVELTRSALRLPAYGWDHEDWFSYLKSGFTGQPESVLEDLENAAIERGWRGQRWWSPLQGNDPLSERFEPIRKTLLKPLRKYLGLQTLDVPFISAPSWNGIQLANACRTLWDQLKVEQRLVEWDEVSMDVSDIHPHAGFHQRVLETLEQWLRNIELAFESTPLPLREWIPILESGLKNLSVGVLPPSLDQVIVGAIDRSRNPDLKAVYLLGMNESVFPAKLSAPLVMDEQERLCVEEEGLRLETRYRTQLATERFLGYIACTRASDFLHISYALSDADGRTLAPSVFVQHVQKLFPGLKTVYSTHPEPFATILHERELLLDHDFWNWQRQQSETTWRRLLPGFSQRDIPVLLSQDRSTPSLDEAIAKILYTDALDPQKMQCSVSRIEAFAACPFRFFVQAGLRAQERLPFELDPRRLGSFQHEVLEMFHHSLQQDGLQWHDLKPDEAKQRMVQVCQQAAGVFHNGLMEDSASNRMTAMSLGKALETYIGVIVEWMSFNAFEPAAVELAFGGTTPSIPPLEISLSNGIRMLFNGIIDRVDLCKVENGPSMAIVIDYKSGKKTPDPTLSWNGIQLQLATYMNVLRHVEASSIFPESPVIPAGAFFTTLRGRYEGKSSRNDALSLVQKTASIKKAYQHRGCFNIMALPHMDCREDEPLGDQFYYKINKNGTPQKNHWHVMDPEVFEHFLDHSLKLLQEFGDSILRGNIDVTPFKHGTQTPCEHCQFKGICRVDPSTQNWRQLDKASYGEKSQ